MPLLQGAQRKVKLQNLVFVHMGSQYFDFIFLSFPLTFRSHQILPSRQKYQESDISLAWVLVKLWNNSLCLPVLGLQPCPAQNQRHYRIHL